MTLASRQVSGLALRASVSPPASTHITTLRALSPLIMLISLYNCRTLLTTCALHGIEAYLLQKCMFLAFHKSRPSYRTGGSRIITDMANLGDRSKKFCDRGRRPKQSKDE